MPVSLLFRDEQSMVARISPSRSTKKRQLARKAYVFADFGATQFENSELATEVRSILARDICSVQTTDITIRLTRL
jgi:hypothetical protein